MTLGPLAHFLIEDHIRLDGLLRHAMARSDTLDRAAYDAFRAGLLRHIGMEEKILLPEVQRQQCGAPLPIAAKLRLDHGALAALLMLEPTPSIITAIRVILMAHNELEEGHDGLYATCERLAGEEAEELLRRLHAAPGVAVAPPSHHPRVLNVVRRIVARAGYQLGDNLVVDGADSSSRERGELKRVTE